MQVTGLGRFDLFGGEAVLEHPRDLFFECRFEFVDVLRRVDRVRGKAAVMIDGAHEDSRTDTVAETFLLADPRGQARAQEAAAQHVMAQRDGRIVSIVIAHVEKKSGDKERVGFVGRLERLICRRDFPEDARDAFEWTETLPVGKQLGCQPGYFLLIKVANHR